MNYLVISNVNIGKAKNSYWVPLHSKIVLQFGNIDFWGEGETGAPGEKNLSEQRREPTANSTHIWRGVRESNTWHICERRALLPLLHPCSLLFTLWGSKETSEARKRRKWGHRATDSLSWQLSLSRSNDPETIIHYNPGLRNLHFGFNKKRFFKKKFEKETQNNFSTRIR